jgi:general secretion pathway protein H
MPMSGHGSEILRRLGGSHPGWCRHLRRDVAPLRAGRARVAAAARRGFTLIELLVVLVLVAIGAGVVSLALRDGAATKLEEEGARLSALLEGARAESRAAGVPVYWVPGRDERSSSSSPSEGPAAEEGFRFVGLPVSVNTPRHWLEPRVTAQIVGGKGLVLGPDAIVPPQRVVLSLDDRRIEVSTDGLAPFAVNLAPELAAGAGR